MKRVKALSVLLALFLVIGILGGCGSTTKGTTPTDTNTSTNENAAGIKDNTASNTATGKKVTIKYLTWAGGGQRQADESAVKKFNETNKDNIEVKVEFAPDDYLSKLNTLVAAGTPPDIAFLNEYLVNDWGAKGTIADLTPYFEGEGDKLLVDKFVPGAVFQSGGKIWGATPGPEVILLYFNKDVFKNAGLDFPSQDPMHPWTWDEFRNTAMKLTVDMSGKHPGESGYNENAVKTYGTLAPTFWLFNMPLLYSNDASYASSDGKSLAVNSPESIQVLQSIADLIHKDKCAPTPAVQQSLPSATQMMINGQLAMMISGQWEVSSFGEEKYDVGIAPLPMFKKPANIAWGAGVVIFEKSKYKKEAFEFMKSYIDPQAGIQLSIDGSWMPNQKAWYTDPDLLKQWTDNERHNEDFLKVVPKIATDIAVVPENVTLKNFGPIVDQTVQPELDKLWLGEQTAEEVVKGLPDKVKDKLEGSWN